ncbi:hypothetical protein [Nocardiopsis rhodophaea]|uniref:hypothetical protein n=1 Tax=Nocardiopsis rhodophaea TaxID=280238 RepID=UPI0031DD68BC
MPLEHRRAPEEATDLGIPRLYREGLTQIATIVRDECAGDLAIDFHDNLDTTGTAPGDFLTFSAQSDAPELLNRLTLTGNRGDTTITVDFTPWEARATVSNPDNSARGAVTQIQDLCRKSGSRTRPRISWPRRGSVMFATGLALIAFVVVANYHRVLSPPANPRPPVVALFAPLIVGVAAGVWEGWNHGSRLAPILINAPRAERPTHWQKHQPTYIASTISLLVGGAIGYVVNQLPRVG